MHNVNYGDFVFFLPCIAVQIPIAHSTQRQEPPFISAPSVLQLLPCLPEKSLASDWNT